MSTGPADLPERFPARLGEEDRPHPLQIAAFRAMSPSQKLELAQALYEQARELKAASVRQRHPDWEPEAVDREVSRIFLHAAG